MTRAEALESLYDILRELDNADDADMGDLNAELEDAIYCLDMSDDDWDEAFSDVGEDILDLCREYEKFPEAKSAAGKLRALMASDIER